MVDEKEFLKNLYIEVEEENKGVLCFKSPGGSLEVARFKYSFNKGELDDIEELDIIEYKEGMKSKENEPFFLLLIIKTFKRDRVRLLLKR